ncbi:hypothetical protein [Oceanibaculum indicum]|uniref:Uncharacterized protein n=1 Tax=Oceanibaculum indicum P24 TaxID=1207063 RepID=K2J7H7_9PROT|nr:hypothetical protein [Oceanibaculum indicum]EKE70877.1 hypothetical protein P24_15079 [Oceanibaculum indicum P24]
MAETIAKVIVRKVGGAAVVSRIVKRSLSCVYKHTWCPSKPGAIGGGLVPASWQAPLLAYAEAEGIDLRPEDFVRLRPEPDSAAPDGDDAGDPQSDREEAA